MALAEAHQRLVRPGIVVKHRDLDDPRRRCTGSALSAAASSRFSSASMSSGLITSGSNLIWNEALAGQISVTPLIFGVAHRIGHRQALEERLERHLLVHFDEDVLVAAEGISGLSSGHLLCSASCVASRAGVMRRASASSQRGVDSRAAAHVGDRRPAPDAAAWSSPAPSIFSSPSARSSRAMRLRAVLVPDDQLAEQRVVEGRHRVAGIEHACRSARPGRRARCSAVDRARDRA